MLNKLIKQSIKDYLGSRLDSHIQEALRKEVFEEAVTKRVRELCIDIVKGMFSDTQDTTIEHWSSWPLEIKTIGGEFKERAMDHVDKQLTKRCATEASKAISGEKFIDTLITRINMKQLS